MMHLCNMTKKTLLRLVNNGVLFANSDLTFFESFFDDDIQIESHVKNGIAHVRIDDLLYFGTEKTSVQSYAKLFKELQKDDSVQGVIIEIDSGGGHDSASMYLGNVISELTAVKPVVAYGHMIASGAYLMSINCNLIIASNILSKIGSIGAYVSLSKIMKEFYSEFFEDVYAEQSPEKNEEFREYVIDGGTEKYQKMANESARSFISAVKEKRAFVNDEVFAGKLYTAENAKRVGLIDGIGTLDYAKSRIISLLNNY